MASLEPLCRHSACHAAGMHVWCLWASVWWLVSPRQVTDFECADRGAMLPVVSSCDTQQALYLMLTNGDLGVFAACCLCRTSSLRSSLMFMARTTLLQYTSSATAIVLPSWSSSTTVQSQHYRTSWTTTAHSCSMRLPLATTKRSSRTLLPAGFCMVLLNPSRRLAGPWP